MELIINSMPNKGVEIALMKDKQLVELHQEQGSNQFAVGDVYLGKVKKVIPSLNAAFVNVGYEKDAFLHYLDLGPQFSSLKKFTKGVQGGKQNAADLSNFKTLPDINKHGKIKEQMATNMQIVVQVAKEPISAKGPRLTSELTLPGRYLVLVPFSNKISLSQRIKNEDERERLRRLMQSIKPPKFGVIVRTVAENKKVAELDSDLRDLVERWNILYENLKTAKPPKRILGELDKTSTILRDLLTPKFTNIYVNDEEISSEVKRFISNVEPDKENIVKYVKTDDIFDQFQVHRQIKASFGKQVNLKSGAYLIIEHTEAMHVIDVNSGNRKGGVKNQEENALQTNLECAHEIARILRLRDMGGIICIDFIDMQDRANQRKLHESLKEAMKDDKAKHNVLAPSRFGVIEITRQRVRPVTNITTSEKCPSCNGTGTVQAPILITDEIENNMRYLIDEYKLNYLRVVVHPILESYIKRGFWNSMLRKWRRKFNIKVDVQGSGSVEFLENHFYSKEGEEITV
jgi:ribonuclease G